MKKRRRTARLLDERPIAPDAFAAARLRVLGETAESDGIGRLSEKSLHRIVKYCVDPDEGHHEVKFLGSVADVKNGDGITEVQTRGLSRLVPKLRKFLPACPVTVIYPLPYEKYLRWIDPVTGEITDRKKSPKKSTVFDSLYELYNIRDFLSHENFRLELLFLNVEEFRYLNGYGKAKKHGSTRMERIPQSVEKAYRFSSREDYRVFFPDGLADRFTAAEYERAVGGRFRYGYSAVRILRAVGLIGEGVREGRCVYYEKT